MLRVAGLPEPMHRDDKEKIVDGFNFSWREAAQKLGTEWGRALDDNLWIKLTVMGLMQGEKYVISDVRFDNEAVVVRENGDLIYLTGRGADLGTNALHASEAGVSWSADDIIIVNSLSKDSLYEEIDNLLDK